MTNVLKFQFESNCDACHVLILVEVPYTNDMVGHDLSFVRKQKLLARARLFELVTCLDPFSTM